MIRQIRKSMRSQKGFTLVELMVVIAILGILAAIAVPKFANSTVAANTSKIAADLRTIDSAIAMYQANKAIDPPSIDALVTEGYLAQNPKPPTGNAYLNGTSTNFTATAYGLNGTPSTTGTTGTLRAALANIAYTSETFHK